MAKIIRFEDIEAWQKARVLTKAIYQTTACGSFARDYGSHWTPASSAIQNFRNCTKRRMKPAG